MTSKTLPLALAVLLALAACGDGEGSSGDDFDADRVCRIGQRLVDETASGDRAGVINQIERLADLDGIVDSPLDVDDLDEIAEDLDANAIEDLIAEFGAIDCDIDEPEVPTSTEVETTDPPPETTAETDRSTDAPPETAPATDPPATAPPTTDAPVDASPPAPPTDGSIGVPIDIGSTGPGSAVGVDRPTEEIIAEYEMDGILFSPNTNVIELTIDRSDSSFGGDPEWTRRDGVTMSAMTTMPLEQIRAAYRTAIEGFGVAYDFTESTSTSDGTRDVGLDASPSAFDQFVTNWTIGIGQDDEFPGVVVIEVNRYVNFDGAIPPMPAPAQALLGPTARLGVDLGWTLSSYRLNESVNTFSGGTFEFGSLRWDVSEDDTTVAAADAMKAALGGGPFENEETTDDSITWFLPNDENPLFSVRYSEFSGTTASYTT